MSFTRVSNNAAPGGGNAGKQTGLGALRVTLAAMSLFGAVMTQNMAAPASSANAPSVQHLEKTDVTGVDPSGNPVAVVIIVGSKPEK